VVNFDIVIPGHNMENWIGKNIEILKAQTHRDWRAVVMVDGGTTDNTMEVLKRAVGDDIRILWRSFDERRYGLHNIVEGFEILRASFPFAPEDVLLEVDGDDWLYDEHVLEKLAKLYEDPDIWLTYGSHERSTGTKIVCRDYPDYIWEKKQFRSFGWWASQLRTFRRFLWDSIDKDDMKNNDGRYYPVAWDLSFMFPMLEMCHQENVVAVKDMMLLYNIHPNCDIISNVNLQRKMDWEIRAKKKYPYFDGGQ
tara:strand:- start:2424 stop:3179 length:756 start_codon:yes stop_codon:yes gene_type:complete